MNDTEFSFIGLVKLNIERPSFGNEPLLSQVRKTYEFGLVFGWAITSVCYPLWTRKEALINHDGENGKEIILQINGSSLLLPLNMALVCISFSQLGKSVFLWVYPLSWVMSLLWVFQRIHCPMSYCVPPHQVDAAKYFVVPPDVQMEVRSLPL